ncbi:hypothetical protein ERY430_40518 [Erythrobacter sp. EC-HK427]|nr:hypothetical protein ERY430_40518 [Erythrobacter sp. EC-HK427]
MQASMLCAIPYRVLYRNIPPEVLSCFMPHGGWSIAYLRPSRYFSKSGNLISVWHENKLISVICVTWRTSLRASSKEREKSVNKFNALRRQDESSSGTIFLIKVSLNFQISRHLKGVARPLPTFCGCLDSRLKCAKPVVMNLRWNFGETVG